MTRPPVDLSGLFLAADDFLARGFFCGGRFFGKPAAGDGDGVALEETSFEHALCDERSAACCI